jgi:AraC-like DNA-binding protein
MVRGERHRVLHLTLRHHRSVIEHASVAPVPALAANIAELWAVRVDDNPYERARVLPDGSMLLFVNLGVPHAIERDGTTRWFRKAWLVGAHSRWLDVQFARSSDLVVARFAIGGAHAWFGAAVAELADTVIDLELVWPVHRVEALRDRLAACPTLHGRIALLQHELLRTVAVDRSLVRSTCAEIARGCSIEAVAERAGVSTRQLLRRYVTEAGLSPARVAKIARFRRALARSTARYTWAEVAVDAGYYDQSHLIRDFRDLAGMTPEQYAERRGDYVDEIEIR